MLLVLLSKCCVSPDEQKDDVVNIPSQKTVQQRRGKVYTDLKESGYGLQILEKKVTMSEVAKILNTSVASVSMAYNAWVEDTETETKQKTWEIPQVAEKTLEDFKDFRDRYFETEQGIPYETPEFHIRWIESILEAIDKGEQQMILSPPRHGKTDLLIHFVIWLICKTPNIRILWVGGNEDIAKNSCSSVIDPVSYTHMTLPTKRIV